MAEYDIGESIKTEISYTTDAGIAFDPTTVALIILDAKGTQVLSTSSLVNDTVGNYYYEYTIPTDGTLGDWLYRFTAVYSGETLVQDKYFTVVDKSTQHYCTIADVYRKAGITEDVLSADSVAAEIAGADSEIEKMYQRKFFNDTEETEWFDISDLDEDLKESSLFLDLRPVQSITSMESYDTYGNLVITWTAADYWVDEKIGRIRLRTSQFVQQNHRVKVVYKYGYDTIPTEIRELSAMMAGMRAIIAQIGGTYDDVTSYSLPSGVSIGVGEPYTNMREALSRLGKERDGLIKSIGQLRTTMMVV